MNLDTWNARSLLSQEHLKLRKRWEDGVRGDAVMLLGIEAWKMKVKRQRMLEARYEL
jgi:hypothetical protein